MSDKVLHMAIFGLMSLFVALSLQQPGRALTWRRALLAVIITGAYGVLDEVYQSAIPGRYASSGDALADTVGAILAVSWYYLIARKYPHFSVIMGS